MKGLVHISNLRKFILQFLNVLCSWATTLYSSDNKEDVWKGCHWKQYWDLNC